MKKATIDIWTVKRALAAYDALDNFTMIESRWLEVHLGLSPRQATLLARQVRLENKRDRETLTRIADAALRQYPNR